MLKVGNWQQPSKASDWTKANTFHVPINAIRILTTDQDHVLKECCAVLKINELEFGFTSMKAFSSGDVRLSRYSTAKYPLHKISWRIWDLRMVPELQTDMSTSGARSHEATPGGDGY